MKAISPAQFFPPAESAGPEGLLAIGGRLTPDWLIFAYRHGIFPWPIDDDILAWWSPDPRAVLRFEDFHVARRLARTIRSGRFRATLNGDFPAVLHGCATAQSRWQATWLTRPMKYAYLRLYQLGYAHSVEVWEDDELAGGMYGVALGGMFAAESMFYYRRDASKVALYALMQHLHYRGFVLVDIQLRTAHTARLGASEISRRSYLRRLEAAVRLPVTMGQTLLSSLATGEKS